jgi:hypothetical protein
MPRDATSHQYTSPGGKPFAVRCEERGDYLYCAVTGPKGDLDVGVAYWRVLADEVARRGAKRLLVDAQLAGPTMSPEGLAHVIAQFVGSPLEGVRIAYLEAEARNVPAMEHGAIAAAELGFAAHVFLDVGTAERWLRYGTG